MTENELPADTAEPPTALPRIPGYRLERRLGLGGMATVYLAVQESLDREVAIKVMRSGRLFDEAMSIRFEHEARIIAKLEHPGIVVIHEVGRTESGDLYYVMPYLAKGDLSVRDYRDDESGLISLLHALLDALGYAHARGIVHRDVKPENVLFDNADRPQLADFGIALAQREFNSRLTGDGLVIGSGAQMSPEQARADSVDGRSDLYSLGVLTYELLTGKLPFQSSDALALALMHAQDPVPKLPDEKAHWQSFIDHAMAKRPEHRFRNAQAMQRALEPIQKHILRAAGPIGRWRHSLRNRPALLVAVGALLAVSLVSLALPWLAQWNAQRPESGIAMPIAQSAANEHDLSMVRLLSTAQEQLANGALIAPEGANAAQTYLMVIDAEPSNSEARAGLQAVLAASAAALVNATRDNQFDKVHGEYLQLESMAARAGLISSEGFSQLRDELEEALLAKTTENVARAEMKNAEAGLALAGDLEFNSTGFTNLADQLRQLPSVGVEIRDPGGPPLMLVPARHAGSSLGTGVLMMRNEVSRDDYAAFANSSGRETTRCRNRLSPLRLFDRRDWRDPGFAQSGSEPVVCVSYADAQAYANWLARRTNERYRLPSKQEWLAAARSIPTSGSPCRLGNVRDTSAKGLDLRYSCNDAQANTAPRGRYIESGLGLHDMRGNVAEWTSTCGTAGNPASSGKAGNTCTRHDVLGLSWQDGPDVDPDNVRELPSDRGYDDVGFRLVREVRWPGGSRDE
ncbi:bifunctional serine/threonine-protein kinase/formylglycine-generating enzyme family protein [Dokdonella sp.]|uniref:bifunctional serine/threonine-protein kinase/formylglycine-generating enzyme family protein n=1 Tax=Dokdonella sp. TaxID=2291710 RepID=UPI003C5583B4